MFLSYFADQLDCKSIVTITDPAIGLIWGISTFFYISGLMSEKYLYLSEFSSWFLAASSCSLGQVLIRIRKLDHFTDKIFNGLAY